MLTFEQQQIRDFATALGNRLSRKQQKAVNYIYSLVTKTGTVSNNNWEVLEKIARAVTHKETPTRKKLKQQAKRAQAWAQATRQERTFYQSYQPKYLKATRTPSQLIGNRLCLTGRSKYNGQPLHHIPTQYLKSILDTKINNRDDKAYIMAHLDLRKSGTDLSPSEYNSQS